MTAPLSDFPPAPLAPETGPLSPPALLGLGLCLLALALQAYMRLFLTLPVIGDAVRLSPGLSLGALATALLTLVYWRRDWLSTPLRAALAPLLGAVTALLILSAPQFMVAKIEQQQGAELMQLQNVVLSPGPAALPGTTVVGNAIVRTPDSEASTPVSERQVQGLITTDIQTHISGWPFWTLLVLAPGLGVTLQRATRRATPSK